VSDLCIGVDLGGTKIEAVVARRRDQGLDVLAKSRAATHADRGYDAVLGAAVTLVREVAEGAGLDLSTVPIGAGMPGGTTRRRGLVKNSNAVCLNGRPFRKDFADALGRPLVFENDANLFALAETRLGAAAAFRAGIVFGVILGSGVGAGIVVRGEAWPGAQGIAGEWGHHRLRSEDDARPCYCGGRGCLERYLSGPAIEDAYARRTGVRLALPEIVAGRATDPDAAAVVEELVDAFGRGLANVIDVLDPSAVVLGGGVSNLDLLYTEGRERVARCVFNDELETPILRHALGDSAGVLGAALVARGPDEVEASEAP
jgi:predicted NBD/HSP70 family sugar kinase